MLDRKKALLINFTADAYHWGCYGTSMEIYTTFIESGYFIETRSVYEVHTLKPTPFNNNEFHDNNFFKKIFRRKSGFMQINQQQRCHSNKC